MRKLVTWVLVPLGIAALVRKLRQRSERPVETPEAATDEPDPADELRRKLADTRDDEPGGHESFRDESVEPESAAAEPTVEERRTEVHDEARAAIGEMKRSSEG